MSLEGKTAIITGAGSGIGRATSLRLANEGVSLLLVDINDVSLDQTLQQVLQTGVTAYSVVADISQSTDVKHYVDTAVDKLGRIDLFHNNAGILHQPAILHEGTEDTFDKVVSVNLKGAYLGMTHVLEKMIGQESGAIVNGCSHAAIRAEPSMGIYGATKHALAGLTLTAASEYGPKGIRVNAVCPGGVKTNMTAGMEEQIDTSQFGPMQRMAEPEEIAAAVTYLFSDDASYVNGVLLPVDGGLAV